MSYVSRGFRGRRRHAPDDRGRVPPGQYLTDDFPVLSAGPTPHTPLEEWTFAITGEVDEPRELDLGRVPGAPDRDDHARHPLRHQVVEARHRVGGRARSTRSLDGSRRRPSTSLAFCDGGYTTNLPLEDVSGGKAWVAFGYDGEPLDPEHGGPARLLVPHLYFWKSAKWVRGLALARRGRARLLGDATATTTTATRGKSSGTGATDLAPRRGRRASSPRRRGRRRSSSTWPGWPGHRAGQHVDVRLTAEDGYQAQRSYSIASAPGERVLAAHRRAARRRRGVAVPGRRAPAGRLDRDPRPRRRLLRLGAGRPAAGAPGRRRLRRRPAAAMLRRRRETGAATPDEAPLLVAGPGGCHLRERARAARRRRRHRGDPHVHALAAGRLGRVHAAHRRRHARRGGVAGVAGARPPSSAGRRGSSRRWPTGSWRAATPPASDQDRTLRTDRRIGMDDDDLRLDGNAPPASSASSSPST